MDGYLVLISSSSRWLRFDPVHTPQQLGLLHDKRGQEESTVSVS
jgi:hypothetical protein